MKGKRIEFDQDEMARRYLDGETADELAIDYGCSPNTIFYRLKKMSIPRRRSGPKRKFNEKEICRLYQSGVPIMKLIKIIGIKNTGNMYQVLKKHGIPLRYQKKDEVVCVRVYERDKDGLVRRIKRYYNNNHICEIQDITYP
ncbi:MAG: hypothetical protein OXM61_16065 [Candidatus Poribacteria bacterium]|nr:hypothetical protein [Candidatus Poribacteria bacterium]